MLSAENYVHCSWLPPTNEVWGKVIFSVTCVKNSVHRGEVCLSACWDTNFPSRHSQTKHLQSRPPGTRHPLPGADTPTPWAWHPPARHPQTRHPQTRHPPGLGIPLDQAPGGCLSACWDTTTQTRHPARPGTPPLAQCILGDTVNKRAVCILPECNLVCHYL